MNIVQIKKGNVKLGLMIGDLLVNSRGQVQFRSKTVAEIVKLQSTNVSMKLTENNLKELSHSNSNKRFQEECEIEKRSRQSIAERSINYMQNRQAASSAGSRAQRSHSN